VQEALQKQEALPGVPVAWHLIGTLQRNKARHAAGRFALIHSLDRADLAVELDRRVTPDTRQAVLVQVNCSDEPQKGGVEPAELPALLEALQGLARLDVRGLMTMSALTQDTAEQRRAFRRLRELRDAAERRGQRLPELSMGMSAISRWRWRKARQWSGWARCCSASAPEPGRLALTPREDERG
jgi:Predicted enzyme with a TIM-barrel fold